MPSIIKLKGTEMTVGSANTEVTVSNNPLLRVYASAESTVTVTDSSNTVVGTVTLPAGSVTYLEKSPTDTITANTDVLVTPVAYNT